MLVFNIIGPDCYQIRKIDSLGIFSFGGGIISIFFDYPFRSAQLMIFSYIIKIKIYGRFG